MWFQEWAREEGNLHRSLMSKILTAHGRTCSARCGWFMCDDSRFWFHIDFLWLCKTMSTCSQEKGFQYCKTEVADIHDLWGLPSWAMFFYFSFMEPPEPLAIDPTFDTHIWQEHGIQKRTKSIRNPEKAHDMYGSSRSTRSVGVNICLMGWGLDLIVFGFMDASFMVGRKEKKRW